MRCISAILLCILAINSNAQELAANNNQPLLNELQSLNATSQNLTFEENRGQVRDQNWTPRPDVLYSGVTNGLNFHLRNDGISYQIVSFEEPADNSERGIHLDEPTPPYFSIYRVDLNWVNANDNIEVVTGKTLEGYNNYYNVPTGNDPALMVQQFEDVRFRNVWAGIDLLYFSNNGTLESDWLLERAEDYTQISFEIAGAEVSANDEGYLIMQTPFGEIREGKLAVFQNEKLIDAQWVIEKSARGTVVSFEVEGFEPGKPMRIDPPTSLWSTFYGGTGADEGQACTSDGNGNLYMSGRTNSTTSIATTGGFLNYALGGSYDAFLVKFNANGVRQWATYYGWSGWDEGSACTTDNLGNVFLAGRTNSTAMVGSDGAHQPFAGGGHDAYIAKFNTNGVRQWGTFYGGTGNDMGTGCATDSNNNVYLTGRSLSNNNIGTPGSHQQYRFGSDDAFMVKFNPNGVRQWGTYFGGGGQDVALTIAVSSTDLVHIGGYTSSSSNMATAGTYQPNSAGGAFAGFLAQFNTDGVQQWGTYYSGTSGWTWVRACDVDASGDIYISGLTQSPINIATPGSHQQFYGGGSSDGYLAKFNSSGNRTWGTYFGGGGNDESYGCAVSAAGRVYIVGSTASTDGIASAEATQPVNGGGSNDAYLAQFDTDGTVLWSSYFGGSGNDIAYGCHANSDGIFMTGFTGSTNVFATPGAHQPGYGGGDSDAFFGALESAGCTEEPEQPGAISGEITSCTGDENTYSVSAVAGATSYTWTLPNGWTGSSTTNSIDVTAGNNGGTVSVTANNNCGSSTAQILSVSVDEAPNQPGAINGNLTSCAGDESTYSVSSVAGATSYTWTLPDGWSGSSTSNSINATAGINGGTISVTANNTCGSSTAQTLSVSVNQAPEQPGAINGVLTSCAGDENTYSVSSVAGADSYTWNLPNGWTGSSTSNSINVTAGNNGGTISVTANNICGSSTEQTISVSVNQAPNQPGAISGDLTFCEGDETTFSVSTVDGATSYTWTLPNGWTGSSTTNSISVTSGNNGGTISVTANNTCGSSTAQTLSVSVNQAPNQPGAISGDITSCAGDENTYSVSAVTGATSYSWTLPNGWTGSSTTNSINATAGSSGGTISVTANNACGSSTAQTLSVSVDEAPNQPGAISGDLAFCEGDESTFSVSAVAGATSYTWTLPNGWSGNSTSNSINATAGNNGGTISVTANNDCGSSTAQTLSVSVDEAPAQPGTISGDLTSCEGDENTYSVAAVTGATSYTWTLPNGWTGNSTTNSIDATAGNNDGTISVTANNSCGSSTAQTLSLSVNQAPAQPGAISGDITFCEGDETTFSVPAVDGATSYTWTLPNGWNGSSTTNSISVTAGNNNGTISVTANNVCGSSTAQTLSVSVDEAPEQPGAISGDLTFCEGDETTFSVSTVDGATSYTWTLPNGWSGSSTTNSIDVTAGNNEGTISVTANNVCGSSTEQTLSVSVDEAPNQPGAISGDLTFCEGDESTFSVSAVAGATSYTWTLPNGWNGSSTTNSIDVIAGSSGGTISVTANNTCGSSTAQTLSVSVDEVPNQPGAISGNQTFCEGDESTFSVSAVAGATSYTWILPNGWTGSSTSNSIDVTAGNNGGTISVVANNACGSSEASVQLVESHPLPTVTFELDSSVVCNSFGAFALTGGLPEGGTYSGTGVSDNVFSPEDAGAGTHLITYTYVDENNCSNESAQEMVVEVCTGGNDLIHSSVLIYPNPFRNSLVLEFDENRERVIEFHNAIGQIVHTLQDTGLRITVDAGHLAPGIYFIRIPGEEKVHRVVRSH